MSRTNVVRRYIGLDNSIEGSSANYNFLNWIFILGTFWLCETAINRTNIFRGTYMQYGHSSSFFFWPPRCSHLYYYLHTGSNAGGWLHVMASSHANNIKCRPTERIVWETKLGSCSESTNTCMHGTKGCQLWSWGYRNCWPLSISNAIPFLVYCFMS